MRSPDDAAEPTRAAGRRLIRLDAIPLELDRDPPHTASRSRLPPRASAPHSGISEQISEVTAHDLDRHLGRLSDTRSSDAALVVRDGTEEPLQSLSASLGGFDRERLQGRSTDFLAGPSSAPTLQQGEKGRRGRMPQSAARQGLTGLEPAVRRCRLLAPGLRGRLSYELEVDARGEVVEITEGDDSTLGETRVAHCVARAIERVRLPSEPGRPIVLLEYAWDLR